MEKFKYAEVFFCSKMSLTKLFSKDIELFRQIVSYEKFCKQNSLIPWSSKYNFGIRSETKKEVFPQEIQHEQMRKVLQPQKEAKWYFFELYKNGPGMSFSLFDKKEIHVFPLSSSTDKNHAVIQSIEEMLSDYALPLKLVIRKDSKIADSFFENALTADGLFRGISHVENLNTFLSVYITEIRGMLPRDPDAPKDKNPEDYYGAGNGKAIAMLLGGKKDLLTASIKKAAKHEFIHLCWGGNSIAHHEYRQSNIPANLTEFFKPEEACIFVSNNNIQKRGDKPCSFLDYELRLWSQGIKDGLGFRNL